MDTDVSPRKVRRFFNHLVSASSQTKDIPEARKYNHSQVSASARLHHSYDSESRTVRSIRALEKRIESLEKKISVYIEIEQSSSDRIEKTEKKIEKKLTAQEIEIKDIESKIKKIEARLAAIKRSRDFDKKKAESFQRKLDGFKKKLAQAKKPYL